MAWMKLNKSKNWNDFVDGVKEITAPGLNIVYADIEGNTGYYNSGKMPIRDKAVASVPSMGWTGSHDWNEFVPFSEMPHVLNPERGYILTCKLTGHKTSSVFEYPSCIKCLIFKQ